MRLRTGLVALTLLLLARAACAQQLVCPPGPAPAAPGPPMLHLSAHATTKAAPDELVADLTALANAPTAVAAQRRVNGLMAEASRAAEKVDGIKAAFRDYSVQFVDAKPAHWTAQQTLEIRGGDSAALLDLVGRLQSLGLAIGSLGWRVSADHAQQAHRDATLAALKRLRTEATDAAAALGMQIDRFQSIRLGDEP